MPDCGIALFRAHPGLVDRFPRCAFTDLPTPVEPLPLDGSTSLYVKRDDRSGRLIGGNKPRKLEFIVGRALARGSRRLITTGGIGTHHGLATTILGREAGLATTLVLLRQPVTEEVRRSLLLFGAWGAQLVYGGNVPGTAFQGVRALLVSWLRGERPTLVSAGGSSMRSSAAESTLKTRCESASPVTGFRTGGCRSIGISPLSASPRAVKRVSTPRLVRT